MNDGAPPPAPRRQRPWIVLSLEGALLDPRPAVLSVVHLLSGATAADVALFEATGEYESAWDIARAAHPWVRAGRPKPIPPGGWRVVVNQCGWDPGDLHGRAAMLYQQREWRKEAGRVDPERLARLAAVAHLGVVTSRDRAGWARAEECLRVRFDAVTTIEDAVRPDPDALLRHAPTGHYLGSGPEDRALAVAARFVFHDVGAGPIPVLDRMIAKLSQQVAAASPPAVTDGAP